VKQSNDVLDSVRQLAARAREEAPLEMRDISGDVIRSIQSLEVAEAAPVASTTPMAVFTLIYTAAAMVCCILGYSLWSDITDPLYSMVYVASSVTQM
jgi:hypothetical protein